MLVSICYSNENKDYLMNTERSLTSSQLPNTVPAAMGKGLGVSFQRFAGVVQDSAPPAGAKIVALLGITKFWWNEFAEGAGEVSIPHGHKTKGYFFNDSVYLAIDEEEQLITKK